MEGKPSIWAYNLIGRGESTMCLSLIAYNFVAATSLTWKGLSKHPRNQVVEKCHSSCNHSPDWMNFTLKASLGLNIELRLWEAWTLNHCLRFAVYSFSWVHTYLFIIQSKWTPYGHMNCCLFLGCSWCCWQYHCRKYGKSSEYITLS